MLPTLLLNFGKRDQILETGIFVSFIDVGRRCIVYRILGIYYIVALYTILHLKNKMVNRHDRKVMSINRFYMYFVNI